jgi:hypothetical protein
MTPQQLIEEMMKAEKHVRVARDVLGETTSHDDGHQVALIGYLQATVAQMSLVSVAQAHEFMMLSAELTSLRAEVSLLGARLGLVSGTANVH